jgi:hypothetical protein
MQSQFVKLCVVWNIWLEMPLDDFRFPFSVQIAALLLDRGVILATEDVKALAFDRQADRELQRAAMRMITDYAASLIEKRREPHVTWLPAASRSKSGADLRWWITYELDFRIWDYARRLHSGPPPSGDGLTRWKYQYGQVARVKP